MVTSVIRSALHDVPLFAGLEDGGLDAIAKHAVTRGFPKNVILINEGDPGNTLYIILTGKVKVFLRNEQGKEVILNYQGPGEYFGEMALIDEEPRSASVMTLQPSKFLVISRNDFMHCLALNPEVAIQLIKHLSRRLRTLTDNVKSLALLDVYGRLARTLLNLAQPKEGKLVVTERLTHQDIANLVGASREMVTRIMKDLVAGGYINVQEKTIVINEKLPPGW